MVTSFLFLNLNSYYVCTCVGVSLNAIQDGPFPGYSRIEGRGGKADTAISYLKKIQKIYKSRDTSLEFN